MTYFSNANLKSKWVPRFAPNTTGEIDEPDLQEFTEDFTDSFINKEEIPAGDAVALYSESFSPAATLTLKYNPTALNPYSPDGIFKIRVYAPDGTFKPIYSIAGKVITISKPTNWTKAEVDYWVGSPTASNPGGEVGIPAEDQDYTPADPTWWGLPAGTFKLQIRLAFDWLATKIKSVVTDLQQRDTATNNRITLLQAGLTWRGAWYDGMVIKSYDFVYHNQVLWQSNRSTDFTSNAEPSDANTYYKRAFAQVTAFNAATAAEVNAGTENAKAVTPFSLANSAYIRFTTLLSGYAKSATNRAIAVTDSLMTAIGILEKRIEDNEAKHATFIYSISFTQLNTRARIRFDKKVRLDGFATSFLKTVAPDNPTFQILTNDGLTGALRTTLTQVNTDIQALTVTQQANYTLQVFVKLQTAQNFGEANLTGVEL